MGNLTLARRDAYLNHVKNGIKPDTLAALRTASLHLSMLFPDAVIKRAEEEIAHYDNKGHSASLSSRHKGRFHPYERPDKRVEGRSDTKQERPAWKNICRRQFRRSRGKNANFSSRADKGQQTLNDSYCLNPAQASLLTGSICTEQTIDTFSKRPVNLNFYCVNTSYPMDNCFTGWRDRSRQTPEKDVLYIIPAGPVSSVHSLGGASYLLPVQTE